jgi:hypothetical protein
MWRFNNENHVKLVHSWVRTFYTWIPCVENTFDTCINVLTNKVRTYEWMNVTWILHLPKNLCAKCVFNAQYECAKRTNYKWMNFAWIPLLNHEMLNLWCCSITHINFFQQGDIIVIIAQCFVLFMHIRFYLLLHVSVHGLCPMEVTHAFTIDHWFTSIPTTIHNSHYILICLNISSHETLEVSIKNTILQHHFVQFTPQYTLNLYVF